MAERIFISSVQKELQAERKAICDFVRADPLLGKFFDVFLFEELSAADRQTDRVYLGEVKRAALYIGIFGNEYGSENAAGISPTEHEFDFATELGVPRLIFVKGDGNANRAPKMAALIDKAAGQLIRRRFGSIDELLRLLQKSLVDHLENNGTIQHSSFEERPCPRATLDDVDPQAIKDFVRRARYERKFPLAEDSSVPDVLAHLDLLRDGRPTMAAILLFGRNPQRFMPVAEVRCMQFHGTQIERPAPNYQIFKGTLIAQIDQAVNFVLSTISQSIGVRDSSARAPAKYEIPRKVVLEGIVNSAAHRDYTSLASVQVSVFADRIEIWNPGALPAPLTLERLRKPHPSLPRNPKLSEALFLNGYIEKYGTGTLMMIRECARDDLTEPTFEQRGAEFVLTLWRDWLTEAVLNMLALSERQRRAVTLLKTGRRIDNSVYQEAFGISKATASRDLEDLVRKGVAVKVGSTGKGTFYVLDSKGLTKGSKGSPRKSHPARKESDINRTSSVRDRKATTGGKAARKKAKRTTGRRKARKGK